MEKHDLDYLIVPTGLTVMLAYHMWHLYRIVQHPNKTAIGINAINRRLWVQAMMEDSPKNGVLAVQTLRNNIMASTLLASTVIMLSSLIALLMSSSSWEKSLYLVFGDRTELGFSIKFFSILVCLLFAFLLNLQSVKYYSHASILINVPFKKVSSSPHYHHLAAEHVARTVNRGSYFWSLGLRAFYFSFPLFFWLFGPIPMLLSCFVLVFMLYFLDVTLEFGSAVAYFAEGKDICLHNIPCESIS
ncbi:hypothetical protein CIPAW_05G208500 [Carya illinoinensis]|uniref:DUF599 domain-containing protein n=1 Tax=Carya illinoinensis TaxID=32201 RepID=A0A8T1QKQ7_CARIL|nr:hypothetical protein CIPAW_05G208500 [Carya illinoinensis]